MADLPEIERLRKAHADVEAELRRRPSGIPSPDTFDSPTLPAAGEPAEFGYTPPPTILSTRYEMLGELGAGGMGIVYKARDRETGELIALKVLRPEIAADPAMGERFKSELRLARQITHKNVCRIYDFNRFGELACISMELVAGESLRATSARLDNLSLRAALRIASEVCDALREAHAQGVIHRDIKPENVMLDASGAVKLMDFGIARSVKHAGADVAIAGTPAYMAPEQAQGQPVDARTDVYAVGMLLYEMLSGRLPFSGDSNVELVDKAVNEPPRPPREIEPSIPAHLEQIVLRCLEKDPARRYQSVADLRLALAADSPGDAAQFEIPIPERLATLAKFDYLLLFLGVAAAAYFFSVWSSVVPATQARLQMDEVFARREAQRWVERYWTMTRRKTDASAEYWRDWYRDAIVGGTAPRGRLGDLARNAAFPLFWRVRFGDVDMARLFGQHEGYVLFSRDGKPVEFVRDAKLNAELLFTYKPPAIETRRRIAEAAVADFCGQSVAGIARSELVGGRFDAAYSAVWQPLHPPGSPPAARVSLWQEQPYEIHCANSAPPRTDLPPLEEIVSNVTFATSLWVFVACMVWFGLGRYFSSPLLLRRTPLALLVGFCYAWLAPYVMLPPSQMPPTLMLIALGLAGALIALPEIVTLEHRLLREHPELLATWSSLMRGRLLEPGVALALLRGAAFGLLLAALEAALAQLSIAEPFGSSAAARIFLGFFAGVPDPSAAGYAAASSSPALFTFAVVLTNAIAVGFVGMIFGLIANKGVEHRILRQRQPRRALSWTLFLIGIASIAACHIIGLRGAFGATLGNLVPGLWVTILLAIGVALIFLRYDVLTSFFTVATLALFTVNTTVTSLLSEVGNGGNLALFAGWCALVAGAAVVAFSPAVATRLRGARVELG